MIIDSHAHIFPDKIAQKAADSIGDFYQMGIFYDGTLSSLLENGAANGIDKFLVHSVATVPQQVESINSYLAGEVAKHPDKLIGFAAMHPDCEDIEGEISNILNIGFKGVKLHPDFQKFNIDSPKAMRIYDAIQGKLPLLIHTGDYRYEYSHPKRLVKVLENFPNLDVIGAHFGGWSQWGEAAQLLAGKKVYVDTSSSLYELSPEQAKEIIKMYGVDRVLFGTDYPMWDFTIELERFRALGLSLDDSEMLLHENLENLLLSYR